MTEQLLLTVQYSAMQNMTKDFCIRLEQLT
jgi:hypothetical protein